MTDDPKPRRRSPLQRRYALCGNHMACIVLDQLIYWWRFGTRLIYGDEWRAKPLHQLADECCMTEKQLRMALKRLKDQRLVETSQHLFGVPGEGRRNVFHYRLMPKAMVLFDPDDKAAEAPSVPEKADPEYAQKGVLLNMSPITISGSSISSNEDIPEPSASGLSPATSNKYEGKGKSFEGKSYGKKAKAPLGSSPKKKPIPQSPLSTAAETIAAKAATGSFPGKKPKAVKPDAKKSLWDVWTAAYLETYPGAFLPSPTNKELGQLKMLHDKLVSAGIADPVEQIRVLVGSWSVFTGKAMYDAGAFNVPNRPDVAVALKFAKVVANLQPETKAEPKVWIDKSPVQLIAQDAKLEPKAQAHVPASDAEIEAILGIKVKKKVA